MPTHVVFFAQDKWRRGNLTLNLGVRYDLETTPIEPLNNPFSRRRNPIDKNNIAPRLGFTWKPGGSPTSVVRGGYGISSTRYVLTRRTVPRPGVYSTSFDATSRRAADPGPRAGRLPDRPDPSNGPGRRPRAAQRALPAGIDPPQHRDDVYPRQSRSRRAQSIS